MKTSNSTRKSCSLVLDFKLTGQYQQQENVLLQILISHEHKFDIKTYCAGERFSGLHQDVFFSKLLPIIILIW
jgi:hypothetical protein